jgi:riboflavin synthase
MMFTGLIEETGKVKDIQTLKNGKRLTIACQMVLEELRAGDSVAVNGACLTAVKEGEKSLHVEAVSETLQRTTIQDLIVGDTVNLERALALGGRLGGHLVQGHVDCVGKILSIRSNGLSFEISLEVPREFTHLIVEKGSITIDGISLTVSRCQRNLCELSIIPHTWKSTSLPLKKIGARVNIECDLIGKYVYKFVTKAPGQSELSQARLKELGF